MKKKNKGSCGKIAVIATDMPWQNVECIGIFDDLASANEEAESHIRSFSAAFGEGGSYSYSGVEEADSVGWGMTLDKDGNEEEDGYEYLFLRCDGPCVFVRRTNLQTGDERILGPYKDIDEANAKALARCSEKFRTVAGTFGPGVYPVDTRKCHYVYIEAYE